RHVDHNPAGAADDASPREDLAVAVGVALKDLKTCGAGEPHHLAGVEVGECLVDHVVARPDESGAADRASDRRPPISLGHLERHATAGGAEDDCVDRSAIATGVLDRVPGPSNGLLDPPKAVGALVRPDQRGGRKWL